MEVLKIEGHLEKGDFSTRELEAHIAKDKKFKFNRIWEFEYGDFKSPIGIAGSLAESLAASVVEDEGLEYQEALEKINSGGFDVAILFTVDTEIDSEEGIFHVVNVNVWALNYRLVQPETARLTLSSSIFGEAIKDKLNHMLSIATTDQLNKWGLSHEKDYSDIEDHESDTYQRDLRSIMRGEAQERSNKLLEGVSMDFNEAMDDVIITERKRETVFDKVDSPNRTLAKRRTDAVGRKTTWQ